MQYRRGSCCQCPAGENPIIVKRKPSGNYCQKHNQERLDRNKSDKAFTPPRRTPIKRNRKPTGELIFFKALWAFRPHESFVSGKEIEHFDVYCMFHVLGKGAFPSYRLYDKNLIFTTKEEHFSWHNLSKEQLLAQDKGWQKVFDLYEELKAEYSRDPSVKH